MSESAHFEIRIRGQLSARWSDWFEGMQVSSDERGDTIISGMIVDDAALHGILKIIRDLGLTLVSVNRDE